MLSSRRGECHLFLFHPPRQPEAQENLSRQTVHLHLKRIAQNLFERGDRIETNWPLLFSVVLEFAQAGLTIERYRRHLAPEC